MLVVTMQEITASFDGYEWACEDEGTLALLNSISEGAFNQMPYTQSMTTGGIFEYIYKAIESHFPGIVKTISTNPDDEELEPDEIE